MLKIPFWLLSREPGAGHALQGAQDIQSVFGLRV